MADENDKPQPTTPEEHSPQPEPDVKDAVPTSSPTDSVSGAELLDKARAFLSSPQLMHEDPAAKRRFLAEKGLDEAQVETLMQELPPLIPPRTYPQPPPSNIPNLLSGALRIFSWIAGGSAVFLLAYFRFIYPRLNQSFQARLALRNHHKELLTRLADKLKSTKVTQDEAFAILPRPQPFRESPQFAICHSIDDISSLVEDSHDIPGPSLLRCAIEELRLKGQKATTEAIFQLLEGKFPWLESQEEPQSEMQLWGILTSSPLFEQQEVDNVNVWSYHQPPTPTPPLLLTSLSSLRKALPEARPTDSAFQKTLQTLSDFTGYIASQTYVTPFYHGAGSLLAPEEEEMRREIRALKGLVLNRRSFLPPRPTIPSAAVGQTQSIP